MKQKRNNKRKINIKRFVLVGLPSLASAMGILATIIISLVNYLHNRPYKAIAFSIAITIIFFAIDEYQQQKHKQHK